MSHYLGLPQVDIELNMRNPLPEAIQVSQLTLAVVAPDGARTTLAVTANLFCGCGSLNHFDDRVGWRDIRLMLLGF